MKKLFALVLALVMTVSLIACGAKEEDTAPSANQPAQTDTKKEETPAEPAIEWPTKPVTVVVGASPGGGQDNSARIANAALENILGQSLVVSNVVGGGNTLASRQVKDAKADGYEVLYINDNLLTGQINAVADYGIDAFKCAGVHAVCINTALVSGSDKFTTYDEMVEYAKAHPGEVKVGLESGTYQEWVAAMIAEKEGIELKIIDTGPANDTIAAIAGGHVDMCTNPVGLFSDYIEAGTMVPLAMLAEERYDGYPDVPTLMEKGVNFFLPKFFTYLFPLDTPDEIVEIFAKALEEATQDPEFISGIESLDFTPCYMNPQEGTEYIKNAYNVLAESKAVFDAQG